jgi:hypothetical protein
MKVVFAVEALGAAESAPLWTAVASVVDRHRRVRRHGHDDQLIAAHSVPEP